jgi:hypothetical protein
MSGMIKVIGIKLKDISTSILELNLAMVFAQNVPKSIILI